MVKSARVVDGSSVWKDSQCLWFEKWLTRLSALLRFEEFLPDWLLFVVRFTRMQFSMYWSSAPVVAHHLCFAWYWMEQEWNLLEASFRPSVWGGERGKYNPLSVYKSMLVFSSCFLLMDWKCIFWKRKWTKHDPRYNAENFDLKRIAVPFHRACYQVYGQKFTFPFPAC